MRFAAARHFLCIQGFLTLAAAPLCADTATKEAMRVLRDECLGCHKPGRAKGGLLLNDPAKLLLGGDSGSPALVIGKADESPLYTLLLEEGDPHMPPKKQLPADKINAVREWINSGAKWDSSVFDEPPAPRDVKLAAAPEAFQPVFGLAMSPDSKTIAVGRANQLLIDETIVADSTNSWVAQPDPVQALAWHPDSRSLFTAGFQSITQWSIAEKKSLLSFRQSLIGNITSLVVSKDGKHLFAADAETGGTGFIHQFELPAGKLIRTWKAHEDTVYSLALSPDGKTLLTGSADKNIRLWDIGTGTRKAEFEGHTNHVLSVAFHPEGKLIASAGSDREIKVWDVTTGEQLISLGDKKSVHVALQWVDSGKALVAAAEKGGVSIFTELTFHDGAQRSASAKERRLEAASEPLAVLTAPADGSVIVAGGLRGSWFVWDVKSGKPTKKTGRSQSKPTT